MRRRIRIYRENEWRWKEEEEEELSAHGLEKGTPKKGCVWASLVRPRVWRREPFACTWHHNCPPKHHLKLNFQLTYCMYTYALLISDPKFSKYDYYIYIKLIILIKCILLSCSNHGWVIVMICMVKRYFLTSLALFCWICLLWVKHQLYAHIFKI